MRALLALSAITPANQSIQLVDKSAGIYLLDATGLDLDATALDYRVPEQDGTRIIDSYLPPRKIVILLVLVGSSAELQARWRAMVRNLSPRLVQDADYLFTLLVTAADGTQRAADGIFTSLQLEQTEPTYAEASIIFYAFHPGLYDPIERSVSAGLGAGSGYGFPLSMPASFAETGIDNRVVAANEGDLPTWPRVIVSGPCDNPKITNETTGKKIEISQLQDEGDYITIDMKNATVIWHDASAGSETNIIEKISAASEFWALIPGENTIHIVAEGAAGGNISIHWFNYYVSI